MTYKAVATNHITDQVKQKHERELSCLYIYQATQHLRSFFLATFQRINADPIHLEFSPLQRYSANADPQLVRSPAVCMRVASLIFVLPVEICPGFTSAVALRADYSGTRCKMIDHACKIDLA